MTREEKNRKQREYRKANGDTCTLKYEKTKRGYLMRKYRNMLSRVTGVQWRKAHLYEGLPILDKEDFYEWAYNSEPFHELFREYEASDFNRKLAPTPDRVDPSKGYMISNLEWVTHSENSRRGSRGHG